MAAICRSVGVVGKKTEEKRTLTITYNRLVYDLVVEKEGRLLHKC